MLRLGVIVHRDANAPPAAERPSAATRALVLEHARYWGVVLAWMLCISTFSGDPFSASNTHRYIDPILRFIFPNLPLADYHVAHWVIRKAAHFIEFFILGLLLYWALRRGRGPRWGLRWALLACVIAALYALVDEAHQAFVPSRSPSFVDSGIDFLGAAAGQMVIYIRSRLLRRHIPAE
jgi:VanZ family protein